MHSSRTSCFGTLLRMSHPDRACGACELQRKSEAWGPLARLDTAGGLEPACMHRVSPVPIYLACQLVRLLINTSRACRCHEIFVARSSTSESRRLGPRAGGELESYALFVPRECGEAGVYILILSDTNWVWRAKGKARGPQSMSQ